MEYPVTSANKATALSPAECHRAHSLLRYILADAGDDYQAVADKMGYTYSYINQVFNRVLAPSKPLLEALKRYAPKPILTRHRLSTEYESYADKELVKNNLTNDQRAQAQIKAAKRSIK